MKNNEQNILIYQNNEGNIKLDVSLQNETVWINRQQMASLFGRDVKTIGKHINNVFDEGELDKNSVVAKFATTANDGKTYQVEYYNLDFAELQATNGRPMKMQDWINKLDDFLRISEKELLQNAGTVSHQQALDKAKAEYEKYRKTEDERYISDFDREMKKLVQTLKQKK